MSTYAKCAKIDEEMKEFEQELESLLSASGLGGGVDMAGSIMEGSSGAGGPSIDFDLNGLDFSSSRLLADDEQLRRVQQFASPVLSSKAERSTQEV